MKQKQKTILAYKSVTKDLKSGHGNVQWKVGEWKKHDGPIKLCNSGFHASKDPYDVIDQYLQGNRLFLVEARGDFVEKPTKFCCTEMRLKTEVKDLKRLSVEFSIWNAKKVLPNYEKVYPMDDRVRTAIEAAEAWLKAKTPAAESAARFAAESAAKSAASAASAAWSAAESAAESAAWSAASAAESAAWSAASAASAAWSAARSAEFAAWSAASAAWSAARSAARSAAESAARSATRSVASAARSAARSATRSAASAAESAARKKFFQLVRKYTEKRE